MTVPSSVAKSGPYICNGVTDVFNYDFRIVDKTHLNVILANASGVETTLDLTTHYTVSDVGADVGAINLTSAGVALAVTGTTLTILRNPPFTQETDLQNQGAYLAQTVEDRFDLLTMQVQTVKERSDRSIAIPASDESTTLDDLQADLITVAAIAPAVSTVAANDADVSTVAGISANVTTVAGVAADIPTVAGVASDIPAVAGIASSIPTVADNVTDITNFSDVYLGPKATAPTLRNDGSPLQKGDLYFDTVSDKQLSYTGSSWVGGTGDMLAANNFSDVNDKTAAKANLGVREPFASKAEAMAYAPPVAPDFMALAGYSASGDGGGALYKKVANEPSHAGKFSITLNDGTTVVWYELAQGQSIYAEMFGAQNFVIGGSQDSTAAFQAASDFVGPHGSWGWRGWHRITGTVTIPYGQSFGPADPVARTSPHYGDFTNWQGAHVNAGWASYGGNLFFDPPSFPAVAFDCDYDIAPHDFTIYADFSAAAIGQNILTTRPETYFNDVTAFRFNKFILASNVGVAGFKWPYRSKGNGSGSGNYYSDLLSPEISRCWCFMKVETGTLFNMTVTAPKFGGINQLFVTDVALRSVRFIGGSIEGWDRQTAIRGVGNAIFFDNTYFETPDNTAVKPEIFYMAAGSSGIISLKGGVTYINHTTYIVYVDAGAGVWSICTDGLCVISGAGDTAASHVLFRGIATTVYDIGLMTVIADNSIAIGIISTGKAARYTPPTVISGNVTTARNMRLGENSDGVSQNILTAAPASPVSGVLYWANGGTWDPLSRSGGYAYPVIYRGGWQSVGS